MAHQFRNDYCELAHKDVLKALLTFSEVQEDAYGLDRHSEAAKEMIAKRFGVPNAEVYFLIGGTQTNLTFLSYALKPYEAVISCDTGHINVHETGAIEGSGHKVVTAPNIDGKLTPEAVEEIVARHCDEHMVLPRVVYISDSTETGTIYTKKELEALSVICKKHGLYLYLDGARLGSALTSVFNDLTPEDIGAYCDAFYIGGTKNGAMFGEALVIVNEALKGNMRYHIKNRGAMLAKGYAIGIQFEALFKDDLYFELARHANEMADLLQNKFADLGYRFITSPTNQVFLTLPSVRAEEIIDRFGCERWSVSPQGTTIRFVTSFLTKPEHVEEVASFLKES